MMTIRFFGTRESIPSPGESTVKYGGNTSCVEVHAGKQMLLFILAISILHIR